MDDSGTPPQHQRQPFTVDDLFRHRRVTGIDCTPTGRRIACALQSLDAEHDGYQERLWLLDLDDSAPRMLSQGPGADSAPRWSPDGKALAFVSSRTGSPQLHLMPEGGEARRLGDFSNSVSSPRWSADGRALFVTAAVSVDPDLRGRPGGRPAPRKSNAPEVAWRLRYKEDGVGYLLQRQIHLFRADADSGAHTQLSQGACDVLAHDVCADGQRLAYSRTRTGATCGPATSPAAATGN